MHEASLISDVIGKVATLAATEGAQGVLRVQVWLGALSHMSAAHFVEHFEYAAKGTVAEGAELDVQESDDLADPRAQDLV